MNINAEGLQLIKDSEGLRLKAYDDGVGVPTIGWGHTDGVKWSHTITEDQAHAFLVEDLKWAEEAVEDLVKVSITENQFSAMVSFTFNVGATAFKNSTMLRKLNAGDYAGAARQFTRWVFAKHKKLKGLVIRREKEKALFLKG